MPVPSTATQWLDSFTTGWSVLEACFFAPGTAIQKRASMSYGKHTLCHRYCGSRWLWVSCRFLCKIKEYALGPSQEFEVYITTSRIHLSPTEVPCWLWGFTMCYKTADLVTIKHFSTSNTKHTNTYTIRISSISVMLNPAWKEYQHRLSCLALPNVWWCTSLSPCISYVHISIARFCIACDLSWSMTWGYA